MKVKRKICVVTGTRAEYGLLYWLMKEIKADNQLQLKVIATAMHLSPEFGLTYKIIEEDGFSIDAKVEILLSSDTAVGVCKSIGLGVIGFADALNLIKPDILVLLGDRYETFAAAQVAMIAGIPIAHIHGGEITEGVYDEHIRHAITKMSHWHFVAAELYRKRVIQLGETPDRVFNFGAPGLDSIKHLAFENRRSLERKLDLQLKSPLFLVTYHPETLGKKDSLVALNEMLEAFNEFPEATVVFTYSNADNGGRALISCVDDWIEKNIHRAKAIVSLGQKSYLSLLRESDLVIGNSSSGIIEAPFLKKATVNIGDRQKGRLKASSIVESLGNKSAIVAAIHKALSDDFLNELQKTQSLYGNGDVGFKIKEALRSVDLEIRKTFYDLDFVK